MPNTGANEGRLYRRCAQDIDDILHWLAGHYPLVVPAISRRIENVVTRIGRWPRSARIVPSRAGVHAVPIGSYPYTIFYRVTADTVEILHVHHGARASPVGDDTE